MVDAFAQKRQDGQYFWLALAPEGTRSWRPAWRSGFYRITLQAQVPLMVALLDYGRKRIRLIDVMMLTGRVPEDMGRIAQLLEGSRGLRADQASPIQLQESKGGS
jgi:hypothetical protein